jgi:hypothetical protein
MHEYWNRCSKAKARLSDFGTSNLRYSVPVGKGHGLDLRRSRRTIEPLSGQDYPQEFLVVAFIPLI